MTFDSHLHWSFNEEHVLLPGIVLNSPASVVAAILLVFAICLLERFVTALLEKQWIPSVLNFSRFSIALWRTGLYFLATFLRLCYMLVAMTFNLWLLGAIVFSLSLAQFVLELSKHPRARESYPRRSDHGVVSEPLLSDNERTYPPKLVNTRPRSKSKPDDIFIHPAESNIARADAVALELGIGGETDRVRGNSYIRDESAWEVGQGRDMAREMLLGSHKRLSREHSFATEGSVDDYS